MFRLNSVSHTVIIEDHEVHYEVIGEGKPLILVHGLSASSLWWVRNIAAFAQQYRVYLIDLPGFGRMRHARSRFILSEAASWLWEWMQAIGLQSASFIGHSMGGSICMRLAALHPAAVERLILIAPVVLPERRSAFAYILPLLMGTYYTALDFYPILFYDVLRTGPFFLLRAAKQILMQDLREDCQAIHAPTLLTWGEKDTLVPALWGLLLHKELAHADLLILKQAGHVCMFDRAQEFNARALAFLQEPLDETTGGKPV